MATRGSASPLDCLAGGGDAGALMRALDWSATPLGSVERWAQSLRTSVSICLSSAFPIVLFWGPELVMLYNDAYSVIIGGKHPRAMGQRGLECWAEIADIIRPVLRAVLDDGKASWFEDLMLPLVRKGFAEDCYFTFTYSPIRDESGGVGGVFCAVIETTARVQGERRLQLLGDLRARLQDADRSQAVLARATELIAGSADVPFAAVYCLEDGGAVASLASVSGAPPAAWPVPLRVSAGADAGPWPVLEVASAREARLVGPRVPAAGAPPRALVLPVMRPAQDVPYGVLVAGLHPMLELDEAYRGFLELVAATVATGVGNARAREEEHRRAEALAELDRAKTTFFSNVSHELRTPLTLMLGPTEDALARGGTLGEGDLLVLHRNELRLLGLVNALLEFTRIEAGRAEPSFRATDLAALTADVASAFRPAVERAGLELAVDCDAGGEDAWVDGEMWEKIVSNLLSNALKFTFDGRIAVRLRREGDAFQLSVADSGIGIAAHELPRVFERFHRVEGARARTHEGSGIGLALVNELARLHGGRATAESALGAGTTFTVAIPRGRAHLPKDRVDAAPRADTAVSAAALQADEALRWSAPRPASLDGAARATSAAPAPRARVLVADDNADMRAYLVRILAHDHAVEAVSDGVEALAAARAAPPDLVLTDVMMPRLDGFGLLRALRADERTRAVPVIMVSARAGEEARVEGLGAGADDYLVKPFSSRELAARVRTHLELARARREAEAANRAKDEFLALLGHELRNPLAPILTSVQLLRLRHGAATEREATVIERQVRHLQGLVDDLLDVARIARGKLELRREHVEVVCAVARAVELASPLLEQRRHVLTVDVPTTGLPVDADLGRLAQVFANLLTNAAKYTEPGGHVRVRAALRGEEVVVEVEDDGVGIEPDLLPRVFDLFVQEQRSLARSRGGLGLGLAIVRNLVTLHGGRVDVESRIGEGTTFRVSLPLAVGASPEALPPRALTKVPSGRRVLVVDDNEDAALLLEEALRAVGHATRVAGDGARALALAREFDPDVVLLDIGLPVVDGYAVARSLRAGGCRARLVALTGYGRDQDRERARAAGFDAHLTKPPDLDELLGVIAGTSRAGADERGAAAP